MFVRSPLPKQISKEFSSLGIDIFFYESVDSTSDEARRYAEAASPVSPSLFVAKEQSTGRGRLGRSFFSPRDTGLYMTLLLPYGEYSFTHLTSLCAVVLRSSIKRVFGSETSIKWVNDLYLNGKKVSGILAQSFSVGERRFLALGIGVNISTVAFPDELADVACSLGHIGDSPEEQSAVNLALAHEVCRELLEAFDATDTKKYMDEYRKHSYVIGKRISFFENGVEYFGTAVDVTDDGELLVSTPDGIKTLSSGEISVRVKE